MSEQSNNQEIKSNELYTLLPTVLDEMIEYIDSIETMLKEAYQEGKRNVC